MEADVTEHRRPAGEAPAPEHGPPPALLAGEERDVPDRWIFRGTD
ncbi:hypothetical protein [Streptomyces poriticola]